MKLDGLGIRERRNYFAGTVLLLGFLAMPFCGGTGTVTRIVLGAPAVMLVAFATAMIAAFSYAERGAARLAAPGVAPAVHCVARVFETDRKSLLVVALGTALFVGLVFALRLVIEKVVPAPSRKYEEAISAVSVTGFLFVRCRDLATFGLPLVALCARISMRTLALISLGCALSIAFAFAPRLLVDLSRWDAPLLLGVLLGATLRIFAAPAARATGAPAADRRPGLTWRGAAIFAAIASVVLLADCPYSISVGREDDAAVAAISVVVTLLVVAPGVAALVLRAGAPLVVTAVVAMRSEGGGLWRSLCFAIAALAILIDAVQLGFYARLPRHRIVVDLLIGAVVPAAVLGLSSHGFDASTSGPVDFFAADKLAALCVGALFGACFRADAMLVVLGLVCAPRVLAPLLGTLAILRLLPSRGQGATVQGVLAGFVAPWLLAPIVAPIVVACSLAVSWLCRLCGLFR